MNRIRKRASVTYFCEIYGCTVKVACTQEFDRLKKGGGEPSPERKEGVFPFIQCWEVYCVFEVQKDASGKTKIRTTLTISIHFVFDNHLLLLW